MPNLFVDRTFFFSWVKWVAGMPCRMPADNTFRKHESWSFLANAFFRQNLTFSQQQPGAFANGAAAQAIEGWREDAPQHGTIGRFLTSNIEGIVEELFSIETIPLKGQRETVTNFFRVETPIFQKYVAIGASFFRSQNAREYGKIAPKKDNSVEKTLIPLMWKNCILRLISKLCLPGMLFLWMHLK